MSNMIIRLKNDQPFEHPMLVENFVQAFPDVDVNNLPEWVTTFERVAAPDIGVYEIAEGPTYEKIGNVVRDSWSVRPMTETEITTLQNNVKSQWAADSTYQSWVFDKTVCNFKPPVDYPTDGKKYRWDEQSVSWVEVVA